MIHTLNLYQRPKQGSAFIKRYPVYRYRHKISANGGFDTASCDIALTGVTEAEQFLDQRLGCRVAVFADNPAEPIWEGFINRISFSASGVEYTISLDEMYNRVATISTSTGSPVTSAAANNTDSQALYGIKATKIEMGTQQGATATTALRDTILAMQAWPKASIAPGGSGGGLVSLEMLGFYHTLSWDAYYDANTGGIAISTMFTTYLLPNVANGTTFFNNADTTLITTNATTAMRQRIQGQPMWDVMRDMTEAGNGSNYFVVGITPGDYGTGARRLYYREANTAIEYTARRADGLRIRDLYGRILPPWTVRPDRGIRVSDWLPGWSGLGDDPREAWISEIDYDADRQEVIWRGADDTTAEGVFQFRNYNRAHGRRFGAQRRLA